MMKIRMSLMGVLAVIVLLAGAAAAVEKEQAAAIRELFKKNQDAVIGLSAIVKREGSGPAARMFGDKERKVQFNGVIIDPSGLTVSSLTSLSGSLGGIIMMMGGERQDMKSDYSDVKMRLADGTEIPARVVMKDQDLDLVFIMPDPAEGKKLPAFPFIKLEKSPKVEIMDSLCAINRMGENLDFQAMVGTGYVSGLVTKPRTFICFEGEGMHGVGMAVFNMEGKTVGISVYRKGGGATVILPSEDVMDEAKQALEKAKSAGNEDKKDDKKDDKKEDKKEEKKGDK